MGLIWKFGTGEDHELTRSAQEIAERSHIEVLRRLVGLSPDMSNAEARGYIRTRAAVVVHREVNLWMHRQHHLPPADRSKLIELATELLVDHFLSIGINHVDQRYAA
ncbi:MAG: hypothetical protein KJ000_32075 [Pirellulaceae bacterium]|jgi:hypothetical protein|nr:hypothetical protein [Pirellulaceae bacterium]